MPHNEEPLVSVVLCTYNRRQLMAAALRSVCEQTLPSSQYEVIVVDNNSTDGTQQHIVAVSLQHEHVRYCFEARQGLSHGRNTGFHAARGSYVAYIDDDCTVPKEWLSIAQDVIARVAPALFGGPYRPFYNSPKPDWYRDHYGSYDCGPTARPLTCDEYLTGTNLFVKRLLLQQVDGFRTDIGMTGKKLAYGEEVAMQRRIRREYPEEVVYYDPRLGVSHLVRQEKMTLLWSATHMFVIGRDWNLATNDTARKPSGVCYAMLRGCRAISRLIKRITWGIVVRDRSRYPFVGNYLYEVAFLELQTMGIAYGQLARRST